jgi:hypothetical protein
MLLALLILLVLGEERHIPQWDFQPGGNGHGWATGVTLLLILVLSRYEMVLNFKPQLLDKGNAGM